MSAVLSCLVLSGCTSSHDVAEPTRSTTPSPSGAPTTFSVPTNTFTPGMLWPTAAMSGTLRVVERAGRTCFYVKNGDLTFSVSWPKGFRGDSSEKRLRLVAPDGTVIAKVGDTIFAGGGYSRRVGSCDVGTSGFAAGPIDVNGKPAWGPRRR